MMFGQRWLTLDTSRGTLVRSYGLLVPLHTQERLLSEFSAVVIAYESGDLSLRLELSYIGDF